MSMAQILRVFKMPQFTLIRGYASNRPKKNHYDTLCISRSSSQKEIRTAFLKMSKEIHPDVNKKKSSHRDFIALNEAYNVLSKEETRKIYDHELKHQEAMGQSGRSPNGFSSKPNMSWGPYNNSESQRKQQQQTYSYEAKYHADSEWFYRTAHKDYSSKRFRINSRRHALYCVIVMVGGTIVQMLLVNHSATFRRDKMLERSKKLEAELEQLRSDTVGTTFEENIMLFHEKYKAQQAQFEELQRNGKFKI